MNMCSIMKVWTCVVLGGVMLREQLVGHAQPHIVESAPPESRLVIPGIVAPTTATSSTGAGQGVTVAARPF